jgi:hypothetical protein
MSTAPAYCGLICDTCPIRLATAETDQAEQEKMRAEIVRLCQQHYGLEYWRKDAIGRVAQPHPVDASAARADEPAKARRRRLRPRPAGLEPFTAPASGLPLLPEQSKRHTHHLSTQGHGP